MSSKTKNNNLNYLIDPICIKVNRLFVLSFENEDNRMTFSKYYTPNVEIKEFNLLTDVKIFLTLLQKIKKRHTEKLLKWKEIMTTQQVIY